MFITRVHPYSVIQHFHDNNKDIEDLSLFLFKMYTGLLMWNMCEVNIDRLIVVSSWKCWNKKNQEAGANK